MDRSRRLFLGAIPAAALIAACSPRQSSVATKQKPPTPATPDAAIKTLMEGNARFSARTPELRDTAEIEAVWTSGIDQK